MILPAIIHLFIQIYLFIFVLIPYFRLDQFQFWDAAGHYFAAWFERQYFFPNFSGWNPFFFAGYPQDTFYPPLYHYVITSLSFVFGLSLAFKLVTIASVLLLPISIHYLARKFKFSPQESSAITVLAMVPIAGLSLANGGTLFSLFIVGLGSHALALPAYLFYFGKLKEQTDKIKNKEIQQISPLNFILLSLLAIAMVLLNFVVAFAAAITALVLILSSFCRSIFYFAIKHVLIIFFVCAFFLIPLIAYSGSIEDPGTILSMGFFLTIPLFLIILLGGAAALSDKDKRFDSTYFTLLAVFAVALFMDFGQIGLPMHAYRFIIFFIILAMMLPVKLLSNKIESKPLKFILFAGFLILMGWQSYIMVFNNPRQEINNNRLFIYKNYHNPVPYNAKIDLGKLEGKILLLESQQHLTPRATEHWLAMTTGNYFLKGLFGDSGNAIYIYRLHQKLISLLAIGESSFKAQNMQAWLQLQNTQKLLTLFQINYILCETPIKNALLVKRVRVINNRPDFYLYKIGNAKIVELLPYQPYFAEKDWKRLANQWFESPDPRVFVKASNLPDTVASSEDSVEMIKEKIFPASLEFNVKSKQNIPILIKSSYFPRWRAYVEGKSVKIYEAAPALMLIYGKGKIKLEYKDTLIDRLGKILSIIGIIWLAVEFSKKILDKKNGL